MTSAPSLASVFLSLYSAPSAPEVDEDALSRALRGVWEAGHAAWPAVPLAPDVLAQHLAALAPADEAPESYLAAVNAGDLYLACACLRAAPSAMAAFEAHYLAHTPAFLARLSPTAAQVDEVRQLLRDKLFVATPGAPPKIASYTGRGALRAWLRVAALRAALNLQRGQDRTTDDEPLQRLAGRADAELDYVKARYQADFSQALRDAFSSLSVKQRNVLRLRFLNGLTDEKIGALLGVHQSTATRWIAAAREAMAVETKRLLRERLRLTASEIRSLIAVVRSQLDVGLSGLLREKEGG